MKLSELIAVATEAFAARGDMKVFLGDFRFDDPEEASAAKVKSLEFRAGIGFEAFVISN
jgi:hypothetical protein